MDNGELDEMFLGSNVGGSMNSFFDDIFNDTHACTHTHKCNPPGPDSSHTHTCYHVHTKILPALSNDENTPTDDTAESLLEKPKKRPSGNREAVRKYREKKKARAASLEDEVVRLRALNQQLMKRVQSQMGLEAEVGRLKCLLVDIRGRIDGEIGTFPYQKQNVVNQSANLGGGFLLNPCNMQRGALMDHGFNVNDCGSEDLQCLWNQGSMVGEIGRCGVDDGEVGANPSTKPKRKGARAATSK